MSIKVCVVGYGSAFGMGHHHSEKIRATEGMEVVGVCEPDAERRATAAETDHGQQKALTEFVEAARAIGIPGLTIVFRHVLPNTYHILLVQASIVFVAAINTEVILSFLGLGIQDGVSWGLMLAESSQEVLGGHFGNFFAAGTSLFILLMGFNLLADAMQDALDTRRAVA